MPGDQLTGVLNVYTMMIGDITNHIVNDINDDINDITVVNIFKKESWCRHVSNTNLLLICSRPGS